MSAIPPFVAPTTPEDVVQAQFLILLPRLELHGQIVFRHLKCPHQKDDAVAEMVGLAWKWYVRLAERGKDASDFVAAFASYAARAVTSGRKVCGQEKTNDVLSRWTQRRYGFTVSTLLDVSTLNGNAIDEALHDNTQTPVPEQVAFRLDFPSWLGTRSDRDRRLVDDLMMGKRTFDVAQKYGMSPGRVSQKRREFHEDWTWFCGEPAEEAATIVPA